MTLEVPSSRRSQLLGQLKHTSAAKRFSSRPRISALTVMRILRGEWFQLYSLARRADRAMRSFAARNVAANAYTTVSVLKGNRRSTTVDQQALLTLLERRPGWTRQGTREFAHQFGARNVTVTMPWRVDAPALAALITRAEVNTILGDTEWSLLSELQTLAARELQHLCTRNT